MPQNEYTKTGQKPYRARFTRKPLAKRGRINFNTPLGRRIHDLARAFLDALGNPDNPLIQANAFAAAELKAFAEHARAEAVRSGNFDFLGIARLEGAAARAERRLNLDQRREPAGPTLSEYFAQREAEATEETSPLSGRQRHDDRV
jgi:hypothetical protein